MKITLCGSARFEATWHEANKQLGLAGHICYSLMTFPSIEGDKSWYRPEQKQMLDLAHLAKIEESDAVVMLNVDDYLGESSSRELRWARIRDKAVYWLVDNSQYREPIELPLSVLLSPEAHSAILSATLSPPPSPASRILPRFREVCKHGWESCVVCNHNPLP